jgi:hypothetical protein
VVAAVHYLATPEDHHALLDYLGEPGQVTLHPWPIIHQPVVVLSRAQALGTAQVMIASADFEPPSTIRPGHPGLAEDSKAGVFNRLNWQRLSPAADEALVDSNSSPVLFWAPGQSDGSTLHVSNIGSQADAMYAISPEYERWVKRVMGWVSRRGTRVWGLERDQVRPDLDIQLSLVNTVYALPTALSALEKGASAR